MDDLIEALTILRKYGNCRHPTMCEHDILYVIGVNPRDVIDVDMRRLEEIGFFASKDADGMFYSFRFGSA